VNTLRFALASLTLLAGCATTSAQGSSSVAQGVAAQDVASRFTPRDPQAEPLALLPPSPIAWARVETERARRSRHWPTVTAVLTNQGTMDFVRRFEADLGFDPLASSTRVTGALYELVENVEDVPRAVIIVKGGFDPAAVRAALGRDGRTVREERVGAMTVITNGRYAVSVLAADVLAAFHPAMAERLARQLSGEEQRTVEDDPSYAPLWQRVGGRRPAIAQSASSQTRAVQIGDDDGTPVQVPSFQRSVSWVDGDDAVTVRLVAESASREEAARFVASFDGLRREYGGRFLVRMMGFGRLFNDGIAFTTDEQFVRVAIDAQGGEVQRALQMASAGAAIRRAN
jgi:hypothetical protein